MSLTAEDLQQIEAIFDKKLSPVMGELEALSNDVKEIYNMISALEHDMKEIHKAVTRLEKANPADKSFAKLDLEQKILSLNSKLIMTAKQAGITLPR